jgi:hypothetical protein
MDWNGTEYNLPVELRQYGTEILSPIKQIAKSYFVQNRYICTQLLESLTIA